MNLKRATGRLEIIVQIGAILAEGRRRSATAELARAISSKNKFAGRARMPAMTFHLAQINIAKMRGPRDSDVMREFMAALDDINALAEQSPGFVWRYQEEQGNATSVQAYEDSSILVNLSVWRSVEELKSYVYTTMHGRFFARRSAWFEKMEEAHFALWWIRAGELPTIEEAKTRLEHRRRHGDTAHAFNFKQVFPPPDTA